jgi:selT/selW/selH-like putative selenoprotein
MSASVTDDPRLNPSTFLVPDLSGKTTIYIEFCDRCRWLHRASWVQTELFLTFPPPNIANIVLTPLNSDETAGQFRVWLSYGAERALLLMWDRKMEGGFPELKVLKQRIRDKIQPGKSLGHSDKKE